MDNNGGHMHIILYICVYMCDGVVLKHFYCQLCLESCGPEGEIKYGDINIIQRSTC